MKNNKHIIIIATIFCWLFVVSTGLTSDYKEYKYSRQQTEFFEIGFDNKYFTVRMFEEETKTEFKYLRSAIKVQDGNVYAERKLLFDEDGLVIDNKTYLYSEITDSRIYERDDKIQITFLTGNGSQTRTQRFKRGNIITFDEDITVQEDDFVRGIVFSVTGNIEVFGEVNKDAISLLGDIHIGPEATVRGDAASVKGKISTSKYANVYGEINYISKKRIKKRRHRFTRYEKKFDFDLDISYNRVDGLTISDGLNYKDPDSLLPSFYSNFGYAFASERWRYNVGIEQTLLRNPSLTIGGAFYRELSSEDDWIIGNDENSYFALLFNEDYKDFYESEGARIYLKVKPISKLTFETGYNYRDTKFLKAHRNLWSLFRGGRLFPENYSTVEDNFRLQSINALDSATNASWYNIINYSTISRKHPFDYSGWNITAEYEWSDDAMKSDYNYHRFMLNLSRYQTINRYATLILRGVVGGSDGFLPMEKRFYIGGPGTLRGYKNKEFTGTEFWMANSEYRLNFPRTDIAFSVFWDIAQIGNEENSKFPTEVKNNIGVAFYIGDDFNISLAKRLDRGYDDDPVFYVRFKHDF